MAVWRGVYMTYPGGEAINPDYVKALYLYGIRRFASYVCLAQVFLPTLDPFVRWFAQPLARQATWQLVLDVSIPQIGRHFDSRQSRLHPLEMTLASK